MSAPVISLLAVCVVLSLTAAAGGRFQSSGVTRRVGALDSRGGLDTAPTRIGNAAGHSSASRAPRRWGGAPPGDWAVTLDGLAREVRTGSSLAGALIGTDDLPSALLQRAVQRHAVGVPLAEALRHRSSATGACHDRFPGSLDRGPRRGDGARPSGGRGVRACRAPGGGERRRQRGGDTRPRRRHTARAARHPRRPRRALGPGAHVGPGAERAPDRLRRCGASRPTGASPRFLLSSPAGWACLATGAVLNLTGWWWMHRIIGSVGRSA